MAHTAFEASFALSWQSSAVLTRCVWVESGYICICLPGKRLDELEIPMMVEDNTEKHRTAYTHTVDYTEGAQRALSSPED